jgi:hypothetical protein
MAAFVSRLFGLYSVQLERRPLLVKSLTSGTMYCAGDVLAQVGETYTHNRALPADAKKQAYSVDVSRAAVFFVYGTCIAGPIYHVWFDRLDRLPAALYRLRQHRNRSEILRAIATLRRHGMDVTLPLAQAETLPAVKPFSKYTEKISKVLADQLVFSPLYTVIFFMCIGMMRGGVDKYQADERRHSVETASEILRDKKKKRNGKDAGAGADASMEESEASDGTRAQLERIRSLLEASDLEDESIERVLALLAEEEVKSHLEWKQIWDSSLAQLKEVFWPTFVADCVVWPPIQFVNFSVVPLQYRVLYVNICNLGWNTFLSFMSNKGH